jgi:predicted nucleotidyltransferase
MLNTDWFSMNVVNCDTMVSTIAAKLRELEKEQNISILYACESGSRAWGFASPDSDFDVRFIYTRNVDSYLSIIEKRDVVELPVNEVLDIGGWDIRKALKLFLKSNAPLYEWLQSPIIYNDNSGFASELRVLMPKYFSLRSGGNHYLSMGLNTLTNDLANDMVKLKRYFYALRPALACKWIVEKRSVPPMEFDKLRTLVGNPSIQNTIDDLLTQKQGSDEKALIKPVQDINEWLQETLHTCKIALSEIPSIHYKTDELDTLFRKYIVS